MYWGLNMSALATLLSFTKHKLLFYFILRFWMLFWSTDSHVVLFSERRDLLVKLSSSLQKSLLNLRISESWNQLLFKLHRKYMHLHLSFFLIHFAVYIWKVCRLRWVISKGFRTSCLHFLFEPVIPLYSVKSHLFLLLMYHKVHVIKEYLFVSSSSPNPSQFINHNTIILFFLHLENCCSSKYPCPHYQKSMEKINST